jgi:hypothetical protein
VSLSSSERRVCQRLKSQNTVRGLCFCDSAILVGRYLFDLDAQDRGGMAAYMNTEGCRKEKRATSTKGKRKDINDNDVR